MWETKPVTLGYWAELGNHYPRRDGERFLLMYHGPFDGLGLGGEQPPTLSLLCGRRKEVGSRAYTMLERESEIL